MGPPWECKVLSGARPNGRLQAREQLRLIVRGETIHLRPRPASDTEGPASDTEGPASLTGAEHTWERIRATVTRLSPEMKVAR
jgi:hypothetical protein